MENREIEFHDAIIDKMGHNIQYGTKIAIILIIGVLLLPV